MIVKGEKISRQFLRKRSGSNIFVAVQETDLALEGGTLTVITGRSGSGKSTLMNMMSGLLLPSSGKVLADEQDLYAMDDETLSAFRNQHFGMIPQGQTAIFSLNILENVMLPLTLYGLDRKDPALFQETKAYAEELLEMTGIADLKDVMPSELSGGEMRRMAIARALIRRPEVIFADEPTGDLDDANTEIVLSILKRLSDDGKSVMLVTHEKEAMEYADRILKMDGGVIEQIIQ